MNRKLITIIITLAFVIQSTGASYALRPMATGANAVLKILDKDKMPKRTEEQVKEGIVNYYHSGLGPRKGDYLVTTITPGKTKKIASKGRQAPFPFGWLKSREKTIDVVIIPEKDLNRKRVLNWYRCHHSEGNILFYVSEPLATFEYLSKKTRNYKSGPKTGICTRVELGALDTFDYYYGRGGIKPAGGRILTLSVNYVGRDEKFVATTNKGKPLGDKQITFSLLPAAKEIYNIHKKHQRAYATIKDEPNYGPYIEVFYEGPDYPEYSVLARYYYFKKLRGRRKGESAPVNFLRLAFIDHILGNKNIYGEVIEPPEEYHHLGRVGKRGAVHLNYRDRELNIRRLDSLKGKEPVFVRKDDERYGYKFYVHDAAEYEKDKTREPEHILVRSPYLKTLVLIERAEVHQAQELIDKGLYLSAISILEDFFKKNPNDKKAMEYYNKAKRLHQDVSETLEKPKAIKSKDRFDFYLKVLADSSVGKDNEDKKKAREKALAYFRAIKFGPARNFKKACSRLIELLDFESDLISQVPINTAVMTLLFELSAKMKTLSLASRAAEFIKYRGPFQKELESAGMRFFNSILDEEVRRQLVEEKKEEWKGLLGAVLQKENLLSERGEVENIKALEQINVGIFEDNGLLGIYNFYIAGSFIRDEKPQALSFSHFILYRLGLVSAGLLERHTKIPRAKLEARGRLGERLLAPSSSEVLQGNRLLTEKQKRFWRPRLLRALKQRGLLDENEKIKNLDAFLSIDSILFTTSRGDGSLNTLYQTYGRIRAERFCNVPEGTSLYHFILKEFNLISFKSCVGYCREALDRKNINAAIEVLDNIKTLYKEEIGASYEYAASVERLENGVAQLGEEMSELALSVIAHINQLCYDWNTFLEEDSSRGVKEIKNFLVDFKERIRGVKERNSKFKKVLGKGKKLDAIYKEAIRRFLKLMKQFLRLRSALKKINGDGYILKQDITDALKYGKILIQNQALSWGEELSQEKAQSQAGAPFQAITFTQEETVTQKEDRYPEIAELFALSDNGESPDDEEEDDTLPPYVPDEIKSIKKIVENMPDVTELLEYQDALIEAEVIVACTKSLDNGDLYTLDEVKDVFERLLAPGFLAMLELEDDKRRWHEAVRGLAKLLPAEMVTKHNCPLDFLNEKKASDAISSAA